MAGLKENFEYNLFIGWGLSTLLITSILRELHFNLEIVVRDVFVTDTLTQGTGAPVCTPGRNGELRPFAPLAVIPIQGNNEPNTFPQRGVK